MTRQCFRALSTFSWPQFDCAVQWGTENGLSIEWKSHRRNCPTKHDSISNSIPIHSLSLTLCVPQMSFRTLSSQCPTISQSCPLSHLVLSFHPVRIGHPLQNYTKREFNSNSVAISIVPFVSLKRGFTVFSFNVPQFHCVVPWATQCLVAIGREHSTGHRTTQRMKTNTIAICISLTLSDLWVSYCMFHSQRPTP